MSYLDNADIIYDCLMRMGFSHGNRFDLVQVCPDTSKTGDRFIYDDYYTKDELVFRVYSYDTKFQVKVYDRFNFQKLRCYVDIKITTFSEEVFKKELFKALI